MSDQDDIIAAALADSEEFEKRAQLDVSDDELGSIQKLANEQMRLEQLVEDLERVSKQAKQNLNRISQELLPDALMKAEVKSFELSGGIKLSLTKKYVGSIKKENEDEALDWFKSTQRSGVITPNVTLPFGKGHLMEAEEAAKKVASMGIPVSIKPNIHWQTLRALVRELYENGEEIPDCISTHVINETKIKR